MEFVTACLNARVEGCLIMGVEQSGRDVWKVIGVSVGYCDLE